MEAAMTNPVASAFLIIAGVLCLAAQPARAQGTSSAAAPGTVGPSIEKSPQSILADNSGLESRLHLLLPDTTPAEAVKGYKAIGDFVTAVHASHDLGVPFSQFKCAELGGKFCTPETNAKPAKIENAILALKPDGGKDGAKQAAKNAKHESNVDLKNVNIF
jgi:hypothetical protein